MGLLEGMGSVIALVMSSVMGSVMESVIEFMGSVMGFGFVMGLEMESVMWSVIGSVKGLGQRSGWVGPLKGWVAVGSVGSGRVGRVGGNMLPSQVVDFMVVLINIFNFSPVDKRWLKPN